MARLIHLSGLHFGAHDERLVDAVEARIDETKPDLVVVSGDFTQRARTEQFKQACAFLGRLPPSPTPGSTCCSPDIIIAPRLTMPPIW